MRLDEDEVAFREVFGRRLDAAIKKLRINRKEAAERSGIGATTLYLYVTGERGASLRVAYQIAKGLNVSLDWLVGHKPNPPRCAYDYMDIGYVCTRCRYEAGYKADNWKYCPGCGAEIAIKHGAEIEYI